MYVFIFNFNVLSFNKKKQIINNYNYSEKPFMDDLNFLV